MTAYIILIVTTFIAANISGSKALRYALFFVPTIIIVGFRYEVGLDWFLYKYQFNQIKELGVVEFISQFPALMRDFSHEPLFLAIAYIFSQTLPEYEYMQVAVYLFFMYSVFKLGKAMDVSNVIYAFIPIHLFLLFTLEFSAFRQSIACSLFNVGLAFYLENRWKKANWFYLSAALTQVSSLLYVAMCYLVTSISKRSKLLVLFFCTAVVFMSIGGLQVLLSSVLPEFIGFKVNFYLYERGYRASSVIQIAFLILFFTIVAILINARKKLRGRVRFTSEVAIYISLFAMLMFWIPVVHNRLMYESIILVSLLSFGPKFAYQKILRYFIIVAGLLFFTLYLSTETSFTYVPYQNYIWYELNGYESDGFERLQRLGQIVRETR